MSDLDRAVRAIVRDCLGVRAGERVVVVCDSETAALGEMLRREAQDAGGDAVQELTPVGERDGSEPSDEAAAAMATADVAIGVTTKSISHTVARKKANEAGARIATLPGIDEETLARMMSADLEVIRRRSRVVAERLGEASAARITCPLGSDLTLSLEGRHGIPDDGELTEAGAFGNLPCGEGFVSPAGGEGRLVAAGTIAGYGIPPEPVDIEIVGGRLTKASGDAGAWLMKQLSAAGEGGTNVAELGVGTNENATLTDNLLEAEKILGTIHVAFGASAGIGGTVQVPVHIDCVVTEPTLLLDGEAIVRSGELLV